MRVSFKEFSTAYDRIQSGADTSDLDPDLVEGISSLHEDQATELLNRARNGDKVAAQKLDALLADLKKRDRLKGSIELTAKAFQAMKDKVAGRENAEKEKTDSAWKNAQSHVEAGERGSSRAYDMETGSVKRKMAPKWNAVTKKWETPGSDTWDHVAKHG
jgi:hypothetical protein